MPDLVWLLLMAEVTGSGGKSWLWQGAGLVAGSCHTTEPKAERGSLVATAVWLDVLLLKAKFPGTLEPEEDRGVLWYIECFSSPSALHWLLPKDGILYFSP